MRNLEHVPDEDLFTMVKKTKRGIDGYINHGKAAAQPFHLAVMMLEIFEKELKRRGFDPTDEEKFGKDIIGDIIRIKLEENVGQKG